MPSYSVERSPMNDNVPHKPKKLYSTWPVVVLLLFFGTAITVWSKSPVWATIIAVAGAILYFGWTNVRTKMIKEELTLRELFKKW